ncbi:hypothetical protein PBY51_022672 [Eleginops maclovinus]|uniref:Uncharacterized protein n=1 Tax=Eleginops maclovinus TaxID=56733 RepID=A0AAN7XHZ0_ELEMC|nr:hypothetical protein PBY51_022672 [Eleginops maclovinus]
MARSETCVSNAITARYTALLPACLTVRIWEKRPAHLDKDWIFLFQSTQKKRTTDPRRRALSRASEHLGKATGLIRRTRTHRHTDTHALQIHLKPSRR